MKVMLTAALLGALAVAEGASAQTTPPTVPVQAYPPNPIPPPPTNGGKDGPYNSVFRAGIDARIRRLHCLRAEVRNEEGLWYVIWYPFP
jgi:hypothetical protein